VLLIGTLVYARTAQADPIAFNISDDAALAIGAILLADVGVGIGGAVTGLGNHIIASKNQRPSNGWRYAGYTFGALNTVLGTLWLSADSSGTLGTIGICHLALGLIDIGTAIWGSTKPEKPINRLAFSPLLLTDSRGHAGYGIGMQWNGW
jgi:hypothetical protein